jgi:hypothetical protein
VCVVGIDPGINGALSVIAPSGKVFIFDVPTTTPVGKFDKRDYDIPAMAVIIKGIVDKWGSEGTSVWIEAVHAIAGDGVVGSFSFGRGVGIWLGLLYANSLTLCQAGVSHWKRHFGLYGIANESERKTASRTKAKELFPEMAGSFALQKHHDRAEALLIAQYGKERGGCS